MLLKIYLMKSQWMTTLFSKGLLVEQGLRKGFGDLRSHLERELGRRGVRLTAEDLAALVEDLLPGASRGYVGMALQYLRPFASNMGFRVAKLSDTQVELVVPMRTRNSHGDGYLHEATLVAAGQECQRLLWSRHAPLGRFEIRLTSAQLNIHRPARADVRVRMELNESARETALSVLRESFETSTESSIYFFDDNEQSIGEMTLSARLVYQPALSSSGE